MWPFKKKLDPRVNHILTDDDRAVSAEIRRNKLEIARADKELRILEIEREKAMIQADLNDLMDDGGEDPMTAMLMTLLAPKLKEMIPAMIPNKLANSENSPQSVGPQIAGTNLSDEQLKKIYDRLPGHIKKQARNMPDEEIRTFIVASLPAIDEDTINRAVTLVKTSK